MSFDHYRDKVEALRAASRATQLKGRVVGKGEIDRLARNVEKFDAAEVAFNAMPGPVYEYACHEGNYSFPNQLMGHRIAEAEDTTDQ